MFTTTSILWGLGIGTTLLGIVALIALIFFLAKTDIFIAFVEEMTAKAVMAGNMFLFFLFVSETDYLNDPRDRHNYVEAEPDWEVIEKGAGYTEPKGFWRRQGIHWVGFWPFKKVHRYELEWTEEAQNPDGTGYMPRVRKEKTDFIYIKQFTYHVTYSGVENLEGIPLDIHYLLTLRTNNPYKALFRVDKWLVQTVALANSHVRNYVGERTFDALKSDENDGETPFREPVLALNDALPSDTKGLPDAYGITVCRVQLQKVVISDKEADDKVRSATTIRYVATQEAEAEREIAEGDADAKRTRAKGDADAIEILARAEQVRIQTVYAAISQKGPLGTLVRQLEALEHSGEGGNNVVWAQNPLLLSQDQGNELAQILSTAGVESTNQLLDIIRQQKGNNDE